MRSAIRSLRKSPALAGIAIASLAFGIGANLTVYSVVRELILDDVSARRLDRLVRVDTNLTYAFYRDIRQASPFEEMAFDTGIHDANWQTGDHAEVAWAMDTSLTSSTCSASVPAPAASIRRPMKEVWSPS
jgi:hypothetical protein